MNKESVWKYSVYLPVWQHGGQPARGDEAELDVEVLRGEGDLGPHVADHHSQAPLVTPVQSSDTRDK